MAEDISGIKDGSVGFLSKTGELKTKEANREAEAKIDRSAAEPAERAEPQDKTDISKAVESARQRFNQQVNNSATVINNDADNLKAAKSVVKEQIEVARNLKEAISSGDTEKADKLREDFSKLEDKRSVLAEKIEKDNRSVESDRVKNINLGNQQKGRIETKDVDFKAREKAKLNDSEAVNQEIERLKSDVTKINDQTDDLRATRQELREISKEGNEHLQAVERDVVRSLEDATKIANDIAGQIRGSTGGDLIQSSLSRVNPVAVQDLLRQ